MPGRHVDGRLNFNDQWKPKNATIQPPAPASVDSKTDWIKPVIPLTQTPTQTAFYDCRIAVWYHQQNTKENYSTACKHQIFLETLKLTVS